MTANTPMNKSTKIMIMVSAHLRTDSDPTHWFSLVSGGSHTDKASEQHIDKQFVSYSQASPGHKAPGLEIQDIFSKINL